MTEHVDFELQETLRTEDGNLRPDARFLLPEGRSFVADSKVPLDAFLDAQESGGRIGAPGPPRAPRAAGRASTSAASARRTTRASSRPARCRTW